MCACIILAISTNTVVAIDLYTLLCPSRYSTSCYTITGMRVVGINRGQIVECLVLITWHRSSLQHLTMSVHQPLVLRISLILALLLISSMEAAVFYVSPAEQASTTLPSGQPVYTLDQLAKKGSSIFRNIENLTLLFMDGEHNLTRTLNITDIEEVTICTAACFIMSNVPQFCNQKAMINVFPNRVVSVRNVTTLRMSNIRIVGPGEQYNIASVYFTAMQFIEQHHIEVRNCTISIFIRSACIPSSNVSIIQSQYYYSKLVTDLHNTLVSLIVSFLSHTSLEFNLRNECPLDTAAHKYIFISGCLITGFSSTVLTLETDTEIHTLYAEILDTRIFTIPKALDCSPHCIPTHRPGLTVHLHNWCKVVLVMRRCTISGVKLITEEESHSKLTIQKSILRTRRHGIDITQRKFSYVKLSVEESDIIKAAVGIILHSPDYSISVLNISKTHLKHNAKAISIHSKQSRVRLLVSKTNISLNGATTGIITIRAPKSNISFKSCVFKHNFGERGAVLRIFSESRSSAVVLLDNVSFIGNRDLGSNPAIVLIVNCANISINNCLLAGNKGTPIELIASRMFFTGNTMFHDNIAYRGGALSLTDSTVFLHNNSAVSFRSNTATDIGGAIFVNNVQAIYHTTNSRFS